jgi:hypothetical protein
MIKVKEVYYIYKFDTELLKAGMMISYQKVDHYTDNLSKIENGLIKECTESKLCIIASKGEESGYTPEEVSVHPSDPTPKNHIHVMGIAEAAPYFET